MLGPGDTIPVARVWTAPDKPPTLVQHAVGDGLVLLCFYLFDWSPT